jgi:hypothetical protein
MFAETLLFFETRTGPIIDSFEKDNFFCKIKGRYISLQLPYTVLIKIGFVCLSVSVSMEDFLTSAVFDAVLPLFKRTARSGIQNWTGTDTGTVGSGELSAVRVRCNNIFKPHLLSETLFPLHTIRGNTNGR